MFSMFSRSKKMPSSSMSVKLVEQRVREAISPLLKEHGFHELDKRNARRYSQRRIDVIQVEFFNRASHLKWGTTPYSFALPIGLFLPFVPPFGVPLVPKTEEGRLLPDAKICHVRGTPTKHLRQKKCAIPNIWFVDPEGKNIDDVLSDVREVLVTDVFPWFERFNDLHCLLAMLLDNPEDDPEDKCWGWGRMNSPIRLALTGFIAFELEQWALAGRCLREVLNKGGLAAGSGTKTIDQLITQRIESLPK